MNNSYFRMTMIIKHLWQKTVRVSSCKDILAYFCAKRVACYWEPLSCADIFFVLTISLHPGSYELFRIFTFCLAIAFILSRHKINFPYSERFTWDPVFYYAIFPLHSIRTSQTRVNIKFNENLLNQIFSIELIDCLIELIV